MRGDSGFATATVMGLLVLIALLVTSVLHDALFGEQLATSRILHQRAATLADLGLLEGMARIAALDEPASGNFVSTLLEDSTGSVTVGLRYLGTAALPTGFSSGRFAAHRFEIESNAYTARGIGSNLTQGAVRLLPVASGSAAAGTGAPGGMP